MIKNIFKSVLKNFQTFLVIWVATIIANQLFIFGGCFAPYCLLAALPHTSVIAALLTYFSNQGESVEDKEKFAEYNQNNKDVEQNDFEETQVLFCPKCASPMVLRTAKNGKYAEETFWECSKYPKIHEN